MIYKDFQLTYKSFIMTLCGALLLMTRSESSRFALAIGLLLLILFSMRLLNAIFGEAIFDSDNMQNRILFCPEKYVCSKLLILFCYSLIGELAFLIYLYLTKESGMLEYRLPYHTSVVFQDTQIHFSFIEAIFYRIAKGVIPGLSLLAIMLVCSMGSLRNPCRTAWYIFWILNCLAAPFVIEPCVSEAFSIIMDSELAEKISPLSLGVVYLIVAVVVLRIKRKQLKQRI